jgi:hypothetical protein
VGHKQTRAKAFVALISAVGLCSIGYALTLANTWHPGEAAALFAIAVAASRMKVKLPGLTGTMSVNLPFLLLAVAALNPVEALVVACASIAAQSWPKDGSKPKLVQVLFNVSSVASATALGWRIFHQGANGAPIWFSGARLMPSAVLGFFLMQTVPVSTVIALTDGGRIWRTWTTIMRMTFPYYVSSAGMAFMVMAARQQVGWQLPLLLLPVSYGIYRSYQMYFAASAAELSSLNAAKATAAGR